MATRGVTVAACLAVVPFRWAAGVTVVAAVFGRESTALVDLVAAVVDAPIRCARIGVPDTVGRLATELDVASRGSGVMVTGIPLVWALALGLITGSVAGSVGSVVA